MSTANTPAPFRQSGRDRRPQALGWRLATAVVAALAAAVGVLICRDLLDVKLVEPPLLSVTDSFAVNYA